MMKKISIVLITTLLAAQSAHGAAWAAQGLRSFGVKTGQPIRRAISTPANVTPKLEQAIAATRKEVVKAKLTAPERKAVTLLDTVKKQLQGFSQKRLNTARKDVQTVKESAQRRCDGLIDQHGPQGRSLRKIVAQADAQLAELDAVQRPLLNLQINALEARFAAKSIDFARSSAHRKLNWTESWLNKFTKPQYARMKEAKAKMLENKQTLEHYESTAKTSAQHFGRALLWAGVAVATLSETVYNKLKAGAVAVKDHFTANITHCETSSMQQFKDGLKKTIGAPIQRHPLLRLDREKAPEKPSPTLSDVLRKSLEGTPKPQSHPFFDIKRDK
jgi:Tfp pilus assembly protein PilE